MPAIQTDHKAGCLKRRTFFEKTAERRSDVRMHRSFADAVD